jgi:hypothetical protein
MSTFVRENAGNAPHRRGGSIRALVGLPLMSLLLIGLPAHQALAVPCSGETNWLEGVARDFGSTSWRGATARIEQRPTTACTPDSGDSFSEAWAMLGEALPGAGYAQIGYFRTDAAGGCSCERYFWEFSRDGTGGFSRAVFGNPVAEAEVKFRVDLQGDGYIHLFYDTNLDGVWEVPPNNANGTEPVTGWKPEDYWQHGQVPLFMEELAYQQSSYKGTSGDKTNFEALQMRNSSGSWVTTDIEAEGGGLDPDWDRYNDLSSKGFYDIQSDTFIHIWN